LSLTVGSVKSVRLVELVELGRLRFLSSRIAQQAHMKSWLLLSRLRLSACLNPVRLLGLIMTIFNFRFLGCF